MNNLEPSVSSLRLVPKIVQTGSLTAAAAQLHMSQSGASHALRMLESQVGAEIFLREWEGLRLSETGQRLLPHIEAVLNNLDAIRAEVAGLQKLETGNLRIAAVPSLLATVLPPLLREYAVRFPGIELSIFEGTDDEVRQWIIAGVAHAGFAALPVDGVAVEEIARDEWLALVPADKFPDQESLTLRELARDRFLMSGGGCEQHIERLFSSAHVRLPGRLMVKQLPTIRAMVAANLGVSLVPSLSIGDLHGCRTLALRPRRFRQIGMLCSAASAGTPALEAWMSLIRTQLRQPAIPANPSHRRPGR